MSRRVQWIPLTDPNPETDEYISDFYPVKIINYDMFEKKIQYADEKMSSCDLLEKKTALDNYVDALEYYISIMDEKKEDKKRQEAALSINRNDDSKVYATVRQEIDDIMKMSNQWFDIRHNNYSGDKMNNEKREHLDDIEFVAYLCCRVRALLVLLKNNSANSNMIVM